MADPVSIEVGYLCDAWNAFDMREFSVDVFIYERNSIDAFNERNLVDA